MTRKYTGYECVIKKGALTSGEIKGSNIWAYLCAITLHVTGIVLGRWKWVCLIIYCYVINHFQNTVRGNNSYSFAPNSAIGRGLGRLVCLCSCDIGWDSSAKVQDGLSHLCCLSCRGWNSWGAGWASLPFTSQGSTLSLCLFLRQGSQTSLNSSWCPRGREGAAHLL